MMLKTIDLNLSRYALKYGFLMLVLGCMHLLVFLSAANFIGIELNHIVEIYAFLIILNIFHFIALKWLFKKWAKYAGLLFTALSLVKMGIAIVFLLPYIFPNTLLSIPFVLNFMVVYFISLTYEVVYISKNMIKI